MAPRTWRFTPRPSGPPSVLPITVQSGGSEEQCDRSYSWDNDRHRRVPFLLIQYTTGGRGRFDRAGNSSEITTGMVFLANPAGASYRYGAVGAPWRFKWAILTGDLALSLLGPLADREPVRLLPAGHGLPGTLDRLDRLATRAIAHPGELSLLAYEIALSLIRENGREEGGDASFLDQARRQLHRDLANATPGRLAEAFGYSEKYFFRLFKSKAGMSPQAFIIRERCARARLWLSETKKDIEDIAEELGFGNRFYFTRVFHREVGEPPARYRKRNATPVQVSDLRMVEPRWKEPRGSSRTSGL